MLGAGRGRDILATLIDPESHIDFHNFSYEKGSGRQNGRENEEAVGEQEGTAGWVT